MVELYRFTEYQSEREAFAAYQTLKSTLDAAGIPWEEQVSHWADCERTVTTESGDWDTELDACRGIILFVANECLEQGKEIVAQLRLS